MEATAPASSSRLAKRIELYCLAAGVAVMHQAVAAGGQLRDPERRLLVALLPC